MLYRIISYHNILYNIITEAGLPAELSFTSPQDCRGFGGKRPRNQATKANFFFPGEAFLEAYFSKAFGTAFGAQNGPKMDPQIGQIFMKIRGPKDHTSRHGKIMKNDCVWKASYTSENVKIVKKKP